MIFRCNKIPQQTVKLALPVQGRVVWAFSEHREGCSKQLFTVKQSAFQTKRVARLSLVKRAVSAADWEIGKTFCLHTIFACKFACKSIYHTKINPSGFLAKTTSLYQRAARLRIFWYVYLLPKFWYKRIVYVQTCGLHRRSMNAPTDLFYKYICL